jgi:hypothetical protein
MRQVFLTAVGVLMMCSAAIAGEANDRARSIGMDAWVNDLKAGSIRLMAYMGTQGNNSKKVQQGGIDLAFQSNTRINKQKIRMALSQYAGVQADPDQFIEQRSTLMATAIMFQLMELTDRPLSNCIKKQLTELDGNVPDNDVASKYKAIYESGYFTTSFLARRIIAAETQGVLAASDHAGNTILQFADLSDASIWSTLDSVCKAVTEDTVSAFARRTIK